MTIIKFIPLLFIIYVGIVFYGYLVQRELIYFPSQKITSPAESGVPEMKEISLKTRDNHSNTAWYRPPNSPEKPTLVYLHGNAGNIGQRASIIKPYLDEGYGVLLVTYRGYSGNSGIPTQYGLANDARAAITFLQEEKQDHCIILFGNSIGSAIAIQMATEFPISTLILQSPFSSLADVAQYHYFYLPAGRLLNDKFDSMKKVEKIQAPVLILLGKEDRIVPPKLGRKLYNALLHPKEIIEIEGKGHNNLFEPELVIEFINKFGC